MVRIERERIEGEKTTCDVTYYISSLKATEAEMIGQAAREHWGAERLHCYLDVVFRQDKSRKMALNALANETSIKGGIATKQCAACCNPTYREN